MSEDPLEAWLPPQAKGGSHCAGSDEYRPPSSAERRRAALDLWLDGGAIVAAALLVGLNLYVFGGWWDLGDQSECYAWCAPTGWVIVILCALNAIGAILALLGGFAALVRGTRLSVAGRAADACIVCGLSASAGLLFGSFYLAIGAVDPESHGSSDCALAAGASSRCLRGSGPLIRRRLRDLIAPEGPA